MSGGRALTRQGAEGLRVGGVSVLGGQASPKGWKG